MSILAVIKLRCPACGKGALYERFLKVNTRCSHCRFPLKKNDAADGPAYVVMVLMSLLVVSGAIWLEFTYNPPVWLHFLIWPPLTIFGSLLLLRYVKALFIAVQYHYNKDDFSH